MAEKKKEEKKSSVIHHFPSLGGLDEKALDEYMKYMHKDNQEELQKIHQIAEAETYVHIDKHISGLEMPEKGKKLEDSLATDLLTEYVITLMEKIHPESVGKSKFREHLKAVTDHHEKFQYLSDLASTYLGIEGKELYAVLNAIKWNKKDARLILRESIGLNQVAKYETLKHLNTLKYHHAVGKAPHGAMEKWLAKQKGFNQYEIKEPHKMGLMHPYQLHDLVNHLALEVPLDESSLELYGLAKKEAEYKETKKEEKKK